MHRRKHYSPNSTYVSRLNKIATGLIKSGGDFAYSSAGKSCCNGAEINLPAAGFSDDFCQFLAQAHGSAPPSRLLLP